MSRTDAVVCQRCGHSYAQHRPACSVGPVGGCGCDFFRWIDPAPPPAVRGYRSAPER